MPGKKTSLNRPIQNGFVSIIGLWINAKLRIPWQIIRARDLHVTRKQVSLPLLRAPNHWFAMQIRGQLHVLSDRLRVYLSDGFCFIRGRLEDAAAIKAASSMDFTSCRVNFEAVCGQDTFWRYSHASWRWRYRLYLERLNSRRFACQKSTWHTLTVQRLYMQCTFLLTKNNMNEKGDNLIKNGCKLPTIS